MASAKIIEESADCKLSSSDEEGEDTELLQDSDTCSAYELAQCFPLKYGIAYETAVTLKKEYILSLCQDSAFTRLAAGLSNATVQIYDISSERGLQRSTFNSIEAPEADTYNTPVTICGVRFLDESANCLLVGTTNGLVRLFDLRTQSEQARFVEVPDNERHRIKNITCFDRNANGRVLCTGTEQYQNNVYLLFFDVRERKQLGGYFESHQDDVTAVRFHPVNPDWMCSGSTDGLINVYDIKETDEDDALLITLNTESSVHKLSWHKHATEETSIVSCITHTNDFKIFESMEGDEIAEFTRTQITKATRRSNEANCNLIDAHNLEDGSIFLLAGTNFRNGEAMRTLHLENKELLPLADFDCNKQIVRESVYDAKSRALITAGESSIVTLWTPKSSDQIVSTATGANISKLKTKTKLKSSKHAPY